MDRSDEVLEALADMKQELQKIARRLDELESPGTGSGEGGWLTVNEAAQSLSRNSTPISRSTVYRLIHAGELEAYQLGEGRTGKYLVLAASIQDFKERRAVAADYSKECIKRLLAT